MQDISDDELVTRFPTRQVDHDTRDRYQGWLDREMLVNRCDDCGTWHEPPGPVCPRCWSAAISPSRLRGGGTIHSVIFLHQGPPVDDVDYTTPHPVVTVELDEQEGLRLTSTVVDATRDAVVIGARVRLDWAERGGAPMPVFRIEDP